MKDLRELYSILRQYHLSESLYLIGAINSALKFGLRGRYRSDIPAHILVWLDRIPQDHRTLLNISLSSTRLARFLILSGANDYRRKPLELQTNAFSRATDLAAELYDVELEEQIKQSSKNLANNILGRVGHWQFPLQEDRLVALGRAYLLFITLPQKSSLAYNFEEKMREYFGIGCLEFMCTGVAMWLKCNGTLDYQLKIEINQLKDVVTEESQVTFLTLSSGTAEEYRRKIRGEKWKEPNKLYDIYFLDPFTQMPAIAVENSLKLRRDSFVVPQPKYLLDRASTGMFYLLGDKEREEGLKKGKARRNPFRQCFGEVYRQYVLLQFRQAPRSILVVDLDEDFKNEAGFKIPDIAVIDKNVCVVFEVKTSLLTVSSRAFFDEDQLKTEIKAGNFNKAVSQLSEFRSRILQGKILDPRFRDVDTVINVLVSYEDVYVLNSYLLPLLKDYYGPQANNLQLASISDVDAIGNLLNEKHPIGKIFNDKVSDAEKESWAFMQFVLEYIKMDNKVLKDAFRQFMKSLGLQD